MFESEQNKLIFRISEIGNLGLGIPRLNLLSGCGVRDILILGTGHVALIIGDKFSEMKNK